MQAEVMAQTVDARQAELAGFIINGEVAYLINVDDVFVGCIGRDEDDSTLWRFDFIDSKLHPYSTSSHDLSALTKRAEYIGIMVKAVIATVGAGKLDGVLAKMAEAGLYDVI